MSTKVNLSWHDSNANEDGVKVFRSTSPMNTSSMPAPIATLPANSTTFEDTGLLADTVYYYRVAAYSGVNNYYSDEAAVTTSSISDTFDSWCANNLNQIDIVINDVTRKGEIQTLADTVNGELFLAGGDTYLYNAINVVDLVADTSTSTSSRVKSPFNTASVKRMWILCESSDTNFTGFLRVYAERTTASDLPTALESLSEWKFDVNHNGVSHQGVSQWCFNTDIEDLVSGGVGLKTVGTKGASFALGNGLTTNGDQAEPSGAKWGVAKFSDTSVPSAERHTSVYLGTTVVRCRSVFVIVAP